MTQPGFTQDQVDGIVEKLATRRDTARQGGKFGPGYRNRYADTLEAVIQAITDITNRTKVAGMTIAEYDELRSFMDDELDEAKNEDNVARVTACYWASYIINVAMVRAVLTQYENSV